VVVAVCFATSEYLRLNRRRDDVASPAQQPLSSKTALLTVAMAKTIAVLATGVVVYLSVNAVTHPATLAVHLTHLAPWPALYPPAERPGHRPAAITHHGRGLCSSFLCQIGELAGHPADHRGALLPDQHPPLTRANRLVT
jgi:hypothetical protein